MKNGEKGKGLVKEGSRFDALERDLFVVHEKGKENTIRRRRSSSRSSSEGEKSAIKRSA